MTVGCTKNDRNKLKDKTYFDEVSGFRDYIAPDIHLASMGI